MAKKNVYKVCWKAKKGFKCESYWTKKELNKKVKQLKKQKKFFRGWKTGDWKPMFQSE